jgi:hypothetical protein
MPRITAIYFSFSLCAILAPPTWAQSGAPAAAEPAAATPAAAAAAPSSGSAPLGMKPRTLAPGVLTVIQPVPTADETFTGPRPIVEIVNSSKFADWTPNYKPKSATIKEIAKRVTFRRTVWNLEFTFKPVRMIYVDIPQPTGKMQRTLVWYMAYRVRNTGAHMNPDAAKDEHGHTLYAPGAQNYSVRFFPRFIFEVYDRQGDEFVRQKAYLDRVIPIAAPPIQKREDPAIRLFNSVQVGQLDIGVSTERSDKAIWGLATWTDIDPSTDFFSIYVDGLTNAHKWADPAGVWQDGDPPGKGRLFQTKFLKLDFWRPGDAEAAHEEEIRFGFPGRLPYQWLYR